MKKILFITGTRADYGKIKSLIRAVDDHPAFSAHVFVSGMHLLEKFGNTYEEVLKDDYENTYVDFSQTNTGLMSFDLGSVICNLTGFVLQTKPDMLVVHGDRVDALAGAIVGALNNIKVAHIEGGEISGTIDESIRHAITKFSHIHLVCNETAKSRLIQMGESEDAIFLLGSPDIDVMLSGNLPSLESAKERYEVAFDDYALFMYHPVTTEFSELQENIKKVISALIASEKNYIVIYPNNDYGSEIILNELNRVKSNLHFKVFPSIRFEHFLTFLQNAEFMIGNSSAGIRETGVYGIPAIDIGSRQTGRYKLEGSNIQHVEEDERQILDAINACDEYHMKMYSFGKGDSTETFIDILESPEIWNLEIQKKFIDMHATL